MTDTIYTCTAPKNYKTSDCCIKKYTDPIDAMIGLARELGFKIDFVPLSKTEQKE